MKIYHTFVHSYTNTCNKIWLPNQSFHIKCDKTGQFRLNANENKLVEPVRSSPHDLSSLELSRLHN